ncbi:MAG TPA: hypothetical protein VNV41_04070 [Candidatus Acidoferrales bacterium]|jgi:hypothetical protein|nr:hypothetical protein [Candidatus Acidoferrales bacterium]
METENPSTDRSEDTWPASADAGSTDGRALYLPTSDSNPDQGPCLFLGPRGQRCDRRALAGGYCAIHRPGAISLPKVALSKKSLAAIAAIAGVLWPIIADLVREILRWIHSH